MQVHVSGCACACVACMWVCVHAPTHRPHMRTHTHSHALAHDHQMFWWSPKQKHARVHTHTHNTHTISHTFTSARAHPRTRHFREHEAAACQVALEKPHVAAVRVETRARAVVWGSNWNTMRGLAVYPARNPQAHDKHSQPQRPE